MTTLSRNSYFVDATKNCSDCFFKDRHVTTLYVHINLTSHLITSIKVKISSIYLLLTFFIPFLKTCGNIWEPTVQSRTFLIFTQSDFKQFHSSASTNVRNQIDWSYSLCQSIPDVRSVNYVRVTACSLPYHGS